MEVDDERLGGLRRAGVVSGRSIRIRPQQLPQLVSQAQNHEAERTRQWFNDSALPKAIRVAQREAYQILRQDFNLREREARSQANGAVGQMTPPPDFDEVIRTQPLNAEETRELAEICVSLYETQKQPLAATLRQLSVGQGGPLTAADEPLVEACARQLLAATISGAVVAPSSPGRVTV